MDSLAATNTFIWGSELATTNKMLSLLFLPSKMYPASLTGIALLSYDKFQESLFLLKTGKQSPLHPREGQTGLVSEVRLPRGGVRLVSLQRVGLGET